MAKAIPPQERLIQVEVKERTGVNLEQYRTDVVADSIIGLIESPFWFIVFMIGFPILIFILFVIIAIYFIYPIGWLIGSIWIVLSLVMGPITGFALGAFLTGKIVADCAKNLYESSLDTMDAITEDLRDNRAEMPQGKALPTFSEWMRVVQLGVIVPVIQHIIRTKLWPIGEWIAPRVVKSLSARSKKGVETAQKELGNEESYTPAELDEYCNKMLVRTQKIRKQSKTIHYAATFLTMGPLRVTLIIVLILDVLIFGGLLWAMAG